MIILGIETSCDETAAAVVRNGCEILSNVIASQIPLHAKTGGVVPEVAAREHAVKIMPVIEEALLQAHVKFRDIDAIAVTAGPGLLSSLLIGVNAAMALGMILEKPIIPVNHVEGHIYANWIKTDKQLTTNDKRQRIETRQPEFPIVVLTVSGGHNELILWKGHGKYKFLGATLDDAAGEAFDKVARLLGLPYPGGPALERAAHPAPLCSAKWRRVRNENTNAFDIPRPWVTDWDFSFSGLKTAMLRLVKAQLGARPAAFCCCGARSAKKLSRKFIADAAASFQESVCEVLATKLVNAAKHYGAREIHLAGGVSANKRLRILANDLRLTTYDKKNMPRLRFCKDLSLCTDNAAMVAAAGYFKFKKNPVQYKFSRTKWKPIIADPNLEIKNW